MPDDMINPPLTEAERRLARRLADNIEHVARKPGAAEVLLTLHRTGSANLDTIIEASGLPLLKTVNALATLVDRGFARCPDAVSPEVYHLTPEGAGFAEYADLIVRGWADNTPWGQQDEARERLAVSVPGRPLAEAAIP